jgi:hypothetical protein
VSKARDLLAGAIGHHCRLCRRTSWGVGSALTLDELALWFDLQDDYWDAQGRKSIDAVALFSGVPTMGVAGHGLLQELARAARLAAREARRV